MFSSFWNSVKFAMAIPQKCRKSKREIGKWMRLHESMAPAGSRGIANRTQRTLQSSLAQEYRQSTDASTQESQATSALRNSVRIARGRQPAYTLLQPHCVLG